METQTAAPAESWPSNPQQRADTIAAMTAMQTVVDAFDLPLSGVDITASRGGKRYDPDTGEWGAVLPTIQLFVRGSREMAAWCRALNLATVRVQRRPGVDTCMWAAGNRDGFRWSLWGSYSRVLGLADDVVWARKPLGHGSRGTMTVEAVAALSEMDRAALPAPGQEG